MRDEYCSKRFVSENRMTSANLVCGKDRNGRSEGNQKRKGTDQTGSKEGEQRKERGSDLTALSNTGP